MPYQALTATTRLNKWNYRLSKTFAFSDPHQKKMVNWPLSPPMSYSPSSCRVSSLKISHQLSFNEELPWLSLDHMGRAAAFASILHTLLEQHLAGRNYPLVENCLMLLTSKQMIFCRMTITNLVEICWHFRSKVIPDFSTILNLSLRPAGKLRLKCKKIS